MLFFLLPPLFFLPLPPCGLLLFLSYTQQCNCGRSGIRPYHPPPHPPPFPPNREGTIEETSTVRLLGATPRVLEVFPLAVRVLPYFDGDSKAPPVLSSRLFFDIPMCPLSLSFPLKLSPETHLFGIVKS